MFKNGVGTVSTLMHSPLGRTHLLDNQCMNAEELCLPKKTPNDVFEFFAINHKRWAWEGKAWSSLKRNNLAWADQQHSSSSRWWSSKAHHIKQQQEWWEKCLLCMGPYSHVYATAGSATRCRGTLICNSEELTIAAASRGVLNKSIFQFIYSRHILRA